MYLIDGSQIFYLATTAKHLAIATRNVSKVIMELHGGKITFDVWQTAAWHLPQMTLLEVGTAVQIKRHSWRYSPKLISEVMAILAHERLVKFTKRTRSWSKKAQASSPGNPRLETWMKRYFFSSLTWLRNRTSFPLSGFAFFCLTSLWFVVPLFEVGTVLKSPIARSFWPVFQNVFTMAEKCRWTITARVAASRGPTQ